MAILTRAKIDILEFKGRGLTKRLEEHLRTVFRAAVRAFARATFARIPVDIGQARASVLPAGRVVRAALGGVSGRSPRRWEQRARPGYPFGRSVSAGRRQGSAEEIIDDGKRYEFLWSTSVEHFRINEGSFNPKTPSSPWFAVLEGRKAFSRVLREGLSQISQIIKSAFSIKTVRI